MTKRALLVIALSAALAAGCASHSKATKTSLVVAGVAAVALGAVMIHEVRQGTDTNNNGIDEFPDGELACALGGCIFPGLLVAAGSGLALYGLVAPVAEDNPMPMTPAVAQAPAPAQQPIGGAHFNRPLPERPANQGTINMAQQVRSLVLTGQCDAAWITADEIRRTNDTYYRELIRGPVLSGC